MERRPLGYRHKCGLAGFRARPHTETQTGDGGDSAEDPADGEITENDEVDFGAVKLFSPIRGWDWYVIEWDAATGLCFGLVHGIAQEFGTFDLNDLASQTIGDIPLVEREVNWPGQTVRELQELWHRHFPAEAPHY